MERRMNGTKTRRTFQALVATALAMVLALGAAIPVAAATAADVRTLRLEVATANAEIMTLMQQARDAMAGVREALDGHRRAMATVEPEEAAILKQRLDALRARMMAVVAEREFYAEQMVAFRADMLAKDFDKALADLQAVQARQPEWKAALTAFIADADALAADIQALADRTGPIWEQKKAEREAFLAEIKVRKAELLLNHEAVVAKVQELNALLAKVRERIRAGALGGLSEEDRVWVKDQLSGIRTGMGQMFDGSVARQMQAFHEAREAGDHAAALAALDQAIAIQEQRPAVLDGFIATAQAVLAKLESAPPANPTAAATDAPQS